eukprot:gene389-6803_t
MSFYENEALLNETKEYTSEEVKKLLFRQRIYQVTIVISGLISVLLTIGILTLLIYFTTPPSFELHQTIKSENIMSHLQEFQNIANNYTSRDAASGGNNATIDYIEKMLTTRTNRYFKLSKQYFMIPDFKVVEKPTFSVDGKEYEYGTDFIQFFGGGSGKLGNGTAQLIKNQGCEKEDFADFKEGNVALVYRGTCFFTVKTQLAFDAKASGFIMVNTDNTLIAPRAAEGINFPTFSVGSILGKQFIDNAATSKFNMMANNINSHIPAINLIADTIFGDESKTIVVGSHSDGVAEGPGINDNGSGSASTLEIALNLYRESIRPVNRLRFAWWAAEELGLLGAYHYVNTLTDEEKKKIAFNLNFDMLGSPNYFRGIYHGGASTVDPDIRTASGNIQIVLEDYFKSKNLGYDLTAFDGRSDYGPFIEKKIPAGGLATGAEGIKTESMRKKSGGIAGIAFDPCYHQACDSISNINRLGIEEMASNAANAIAFFATHPDLSGFLKRDLPPSMAIDSSEDVSIRKENRQ